MSEINNLNGKTDLSIIIINYNLSKEIEDCLNSLLLVLDSLKDFRCEIIIVDNASFNDTPELITEKYPDVRLLLLPHNYA